MTYSVQGFLSLKKYVREILVKHLFKERAKTDINIETNGIWDKSWFHFFIIKRKDMQKVRLDRQRFHFYANRHNLFKNLS